MNMPLATAIEDYFVARSPRKDSAHTLAAYRNDLDQVTAVLATQAGLEPAQLTVDHLGLSAMRRAFATYAADRSRATIRRCWSTWSGFFNHLVSEGLVEGNPMAGVARPPAPRRQPKAFTTADTDRILRGLRDGARTGTDPWPERDLAIVFTLLVTGVRSAELLGTRIDSLTGPQGERALRVRGKGDADRTVPVEPLLEQVIDTYLATRRDRFPQQASRRNLPEHPRPLDWFPPDAPLFVDRSGEPLRRGGLQYLVRSAYRHAGVDSQRERGALVHALRHTFATRMVEDPENTVVQVMELLGHRSMATTQNYVTAAGRNVRRAVASNPAYDALGDG